MRPSTRERILDVALDLFVEEGYSGTPITEVERRSGLSPGSGSFYRHFGSKEELLHRVVEREVALCVAAIDAEHAQLPEADGTDGRRLAGLEQTLRDIRRFDRLFRLMMNEGDRVPAVAEAVTNALRGPSARLPWKEMPNFVVAMAALGGYHFFGLLQGGPFQGIAEDEFIRTVAKVTEPR